MHQQINALSGSQLGELLTKVLVTCLCLLADFGVHFGAHWILKGSPNPPTLWSGVLEDLEATGEFPAPYLPPLRAPCQGTSKTSTRLG